MKVLLEFSAAVSAQVGNDNFCSAVGFSRQPLPKGMHFAIVSNAGRAGIKATDAAVPRGLGLVTLRPVTNGSVMAKQPPTANIFPGEAA